MNWQISKKRTKRVNVSFEWTNKSDLRLILDDLSDFIALGRENYLNYKTSAENKDKTHLVQFEQFYVDTIHESKESEINGELRFVIKSNL